MNKTQKGFAALEALLILIIIVVIGGIGWYVVHTKHQTDKILIQADKISQTTPAKNTKTVSTRSNASNATSGYLVIKEWGVELPLTSDIQDASYAKITNHPDPSNTFGLSTSTLTNMDSRCAASSNGVGYLFRQTVAEHDANKTKDDALNYPVYSTKIGDYYYQFVRTQAACSQNDSASQKQQSYFQSFINAFAGIKAAP